MIDQYTVIHGGKTEKTLKAEGRKRIRERHNCLKHLPQAKSCEPFTVIECRCGRQWVSDYFLPEDPTSILKWEKYP